MLSVVRLLMFGGVLGKTLGVARELVAGWLFGTGAVASAYRMAQSAFLIPLNGFASDALNGALTPRLARHAAAGDSRASHLVAGMHAVVLLVSLVTAVLMYAFARQWVGLLAPGFDASTASMAVSMVCMMTLGMVPHFLCSLYASVELAHGGGRLTALRASVQSAGLLAGTVAAWCFEQPLWIPAGFVAAQWLLAGWGWSVIRRMHYRFWPSRATWRPVRSELMQIWKAFRILLWVPVAMQIHFVVERQVASLTHPEAVAALDYARFLSDTAIYLLAMPFGMAGLAAMSSMDRHEFQEAAAKSARILLVITVPMSAFVVAHAEWVVSLLFGRGAFDTQSVDLTATVLRGMALGMWAQVLAYACLKFLNAQGRHALVLSIMVSGALLNAALNYWGWRYFGPAVLGLSAALNAIFMLPLVVWALTIGRHLYSDLAYLGFLFVLYIGVWRWLGRAPNEMVFVPLFGAFFWGAAIMLRARYRAMFFALMKPRV